MCTCRSAQGAVLIVWLTSLAMTMPTTAQRSAARRSAAHLVGLDVVQQALVVGDHEDAHAWPLRLQAVHRLGDVAQRVNVEACGQTR